MDETRRTDATLRLHRTARALAELDEVEARLAATEDAAVAEALLPFVDKAQDAVGEAFALDTADRNDPVTARSVSGSLAGLRWLRWLLTSDGVAS